MEIERVDVAYPRTYAIVEDGEVVKKVSLSIIPLQKLSSVVSLEEIEKLEYTGAIKYAVRLLARQAMHSRQLDTKFSLHYVGENVREGVCEYCCRQGWVDDDAWVESKVRQWQRQGKSEREIRFRFQRLGIEVGAVHSSDRETLASFIERKYPQLFQDQIPKKEKDRIIRSLLRRGFSYSLIKEILYDKANNCIMREE